VLGLGTGCQDLSTTGLMNLPAPSPETGNFLEEYVGKRSNRGGCIENTDESQVKGKKGTTCKGAAPAGNKLKEIRASRVPLTAS